MAEFFNEDRWQQAITHPDWYLQLGDELQALRKKWENDQTDESERMKHEVRGFFRQALASGQVALGSTGPQFDAERQPVDTIVIHHTSAEPGYDLDYMNATQLLNVYVPYFANPDAENSSYKGKGIWSGHMRGGKQVFFVYHWLMRMDGSFEQLLNDDEIGWHAANWDVNRRSVGICLDNAYEQQSPAPEIIERLGRFISEQYPGVPKERLVGHCEVAQKPTACPGSGFVDGWKESLQAAVS